jgi:Tfp pilus assembly protein PilF
MQYLSFISNTTDKKLTMKAIPCIFLLLLHSVLDAQQPAHINVTNKVFTTYPFGDPDPIPDPAAAIYPYNHFDGYTNQPIQKQWKVVVLENDFLEVQVLPEIGGKIWSAVEKKTGKAFIYYNHVVKFRDVAMRGPWTSGGIEANYGIIGHTPNCATPVDYTTRTNADGSVSCIVGALDLLTRTTWRVEINLPSNKAYFTTRSTWFNASGMEQPYYHWMNAGIKAAGNLEFVYPGTNFLGHEGEVGDWPVNTKNNKAINWYKNNNFGSYKSYHVFGKYTNFFGGYWHDDAYGVVRYADHDDKPGKKLWIWGLSRQGMIWENLLSDTDGQYTEIQSGRLFNQSAAASALTPFKHRGFAPYATDTWTEYWYPVLQTKGYVFANTLGALNVRAEDNWLKLYFSPVQAISDTLTVMHNGKILYSKKISGTPLTLIMDSLKWKGSQNSLRITLGNNKLVWQGNDTTDNISRPVALPQSFDQNGLYGLYLQGKNNLYFRNYVLAEEQLMACLAKDNGFVPALADMSMLLYRKMQYSEALVYAKKALSINTYDPAANYYYGLINQRLGNRTDALDGFDIATQSEEFRTPAFTALAKINFSATGNNDKAVHYAQKALQYNQQNTDAWQVLAAAHRLAGNQPAAVEALHQISLYDPLNCFVPFENWLWKQTTEAKKNLTAALQNEMPDQSMLELALWYYAIGCTSNCVQALQVYPGNAETYYWLAYLHKGSGTEQSFYEKALTAALPTAFPFRQESALPLRWYAEHSAGWQPMYLLALVEGGCGNRANAAALLNKCGQQPNEGSFYAARAKMNAADTAAAIADITKAMVLDPAQWRYYKQLAEIYNKQGRYKEALPVIAGYYQKNPTHYIMGMLLAKTYILDKQYGQAATLLNKVVIIPYEGATDGRRLYKEAHLMLAVQNLQQKNYKKAIANIKTAQLWPERLGVGKPYTEDIDERLENFLLYQSYTAVGDKDRAAAAIELIKQNKAAVYTSNKVITEWANGNETALNDLPASAVTDDNGRILAEWLKQQ